MTPVLVTAADVMVTVRGVEAPRSRIDSVCVFPAFSGNKPARNRPQLPSLDIGAIDSDDPCAAGEIHRRLGRSCQETPASNGHAG
jgi:hypothetical protein